MEPVDNNQFEVVPTHKRKIATPCPNVYLNPALDLLANEDPMCNTAMELVPNKKRKRSKSCDIIAFENNALDIGISKAAVNEFLIKELENVRKNVRYCSEPTTIGSKVNVENFDPKNEVYMPNLNKSEPKIFLSRPNFDEFDVNTLSESNTLPKNCSIDSVSTPFLKESIYANLTDIVPEQETENQAIDGMPESYVCEIIEPTCSDAFTVPQTIKEVDTSVSPTESNIDDSLSENGIELSKIDNITDSGISIIDQQFSTVQNLEHNDISSINNTTIHTNVRNQIFVNNNSNLNLSFIDRLALDSPNLSNQSLMLDDDLNESNIMEIKTITIITKKKRIPSIKRNTNPFLDPNLKDKLDDNPSETENPFLKMNEAKNDSELEYNEEMMNRPVQVLHPPTSQLLPRRLFDTNSTISTVNETFDQNEYENIDNYRPESPIYENIGDMTETNYNKQSKILGHDVSQFSAVDIMNINRNSKVNSSNESNESKKDSKNHLFKAFKPKKVFKKIKNTFKVDKNSSVRHNATLNPYEIPRKLPKERSIISEESGIENPGLNLDVSDIEIEELDDIEDDDEEHQYETIKTLRNTRLNMNVTPLKERNIEMDISHNKTNTPGKKVRFDSTLNQQKIITGNSFDFDLQSPGFDSKIDKYHDELENCINEKKFLQQNM